MRIKDDERVVMSFQGDEEESAATEEEKMQDDQEERKGSVSSRDVINFKSSSSGSHTKSNSLTQHSPFFYNSFT